MKRRDFVKRASVGAFASVVGTGCGVNGPAEEISTGSESEVSWRLVSSFPPSLSTLYGASENLARRVGELTGGRFQIAPNAAGKIVPGLAVMDAVTSGAVQCGHSVSSYFMGKDPTLVFDSTVPFGLNTRQQNAWLYEGEGFRLMRERFAEQNIVNFPGGNTGPQMGGWFRNELNSLSDLQGLRMRIPGLGGKVMDRLGVTVQVLAGGDVYLALERGVIDGAEFSGPADDEILGLNQIADYYYAPGWWEPATNVSFYVNRDAWESLPALYQSAFEVASREANLFMTIRYDILNPAAFRRFEQAGVQFRQFPEDIIEAAQQATLEIMQEYADSDDTFRIIYDSWKVARNDAAAWSAVSDRSYAQFSF